MSIRKVIKAFTPNGIIILKRKINEGRYSSLKTITGRIEEIRSEHGYVGLNMGCGPEDHKPAYLNCDGQKKLSEFHVDATKTLPIPDNSLDFVYSEHFIEHIPADDALFFIRESHRVLKTGGIFRCLTPDLRSLIDLAEDTSAEPMGRLRNVMINGNPLPGGGVRPGPAVSRGMAEIWDDLDGVINDFMRRYGHQYLWSAGHLARAVENAGFQDSQVMPYAESSDDRVCLDPIGRWGWEWTSAIEARK